MCGTCGWKHGWLLTAGQQGSNGSAPGHQTEQPQHEDEDEEEEEEEEEEGTEGQI